MKGFYVSAYEHLKEQVLAEPKVWLVTGVAGFIGSNLLETLLRQNQRVIGLDNYATGSRRNLEQVQELVGPERWNNFRQIDGDIRDLDTCKQASQGVDYVLHQEALGSVPRSIETPEDSHASNVTGFLNVLMATRDNGVKRLVYASSSSVYGDDPKLPKVEDNIGRCLSPYAETKRAISVVRLLAKKTFEPRVIIERIIHVERLKKLRVHVQQLGGLFNIGHGIWVEISARTLGCETRNNS